MNHFESPECSMSVDLDLEAFDQVKTTRKTHGPLEFTYSYSRTVADKANNMFDTQVLLQCKHQDPLTTWYLDVNVEVIETTQKTSCLSSRNFNFNNSNTLFLVNKNHKGVVNGLKKTFVMKINIISYQQSDRTSVTQKIYEKNSNVTLLVEGYRVNVNKEYLSVYSPYFDRMFFGVFAEKSKSEISLPGIKYVPIIQLLNIIYMTNQQIDKENIADLLELSDRFQMSFVLQKIEVFLLGNSSVPLGQKLYFADKYRMEIAQKVLFKDFMTSSTVDDVKFLKQHRHDVSHETQMMVLDRGFELLL